MAYNLTDDSVLNNIVQMVESAENDQRIDRHTRAYQIINENQKRLVEEQLRKKYPESWNEMTVMNLTIGKKMIRKLSRAYSAGVRREVVDVKTGEVNKRLTEFLNYVYADPSEDGNTFDDVMIKASELYTNHQYVELFNYLSDDNRIRFKALPQQLFTAIPNTSKTKAEVIVFKLDHADFTTAHKFIDWDNTPEEAMGGEVVGLYNVWSKDYNFVFTRIKKEITEGEGKGQVIFTNVVTKNPKNEGNKNPFAVMPFTQIKKATDGHFYPHGNEIAEVSRDLNVIFSDIIHIAAQQGFGQAVIYYDGETPPAITKTGPTHVININNKNGNSKFEFANPNPDLPGHLEIALAITRILLTTNDLTTDKVSGELNATNFASAIDRLIADSETVTNIEDQQKDYARIEKDNFKKVISIAKYLKDSNQWPDDYPKLNTPDFGENKYKLKIIFNAIKPLTTEKEKATTIVYLDENGFILPHEKHMRFNDGMSEKEALKREAEIRAAKKIDEEEEIGKKADEINREIQAGNAKGQENRPVSSIEGRQGKDRVAGNIKRSGQKADRKLDNRANKEKDTGGSRSRER